MLSIQHPYIAVATRAGESYGGGQQFSGDAMIRRCGCGIIAATDLLLYLCRRDKRNMPACFAAFSEDAPLPLEQYNACIDTMHRRYFPVIPYAGINGLMLMAGVQRFFHDSGLPYRARWCVSQSRLWERIEAMLRADIPVIMSVGQNIPFIWQNNRLRFYRETPQGTLVPSAAAKAHFYTVTGMDEKWLQISSWGRRYFLSRREFEDYVRRHSASVISNILLIEKK